MPFFSFTRPILKQPATSLEFTTVNDGTANSPDDEANYLLGEVNAGLVPPGDDIKYTVYALNSGDLDAEDVRISDWTQIVGGARSTT